MGLYSEPSMELLCQQVVRDNPELAGRVTPGSVGVRGVPVAKNINGRNTQITLVGKPGKGFAGEATVYYDRLNLTSLFKAPLPLYVPNTMTKVADLLPLLRDGYGIQLDISEISVPSQNIQPVATLTSLVITATNSPGYTGTLTINYAAQPYGDFPDSGPGSKQLLAGNELNGYFGIVPQGVMLSAVELWGGAFPGTNITAAQLTGYVWLKFFMNGNVVYLPSRGVGPSSFASLYDAGAIFGTGDYGNMPSNITTPVTQQLYLSKTEGEKTYYFSLKIPDTGDLTVPPFSILRRLGDGDSAGEWGNETTVQWGDQVLFSSISGTKNLVRNLKGSYGTWIDNWTQAQWWPIAELLDKSNIVLPLADIEGVVEWACRPVTFTGATYDDPIHPLSIELATTPLPRPPATFADTSSPTIAPIGLLEPSVDTAKPLPTTSYNLWFVLPIGLESPHVDMPRPLPPSTGDKQIKIDIASADGELDGFQ
ncbi:putative virion structural protein [Salmonella phage SPAsTU]|nr:putative virion structural protein 17 [Salmonella phage STsAS]AWN08972.1 putative virion structural protein [Salmonella phage SPAsTU]